MCLPGSRGLAPYMSPRPTASHICRLIEFPVWALSRSPPLAECWGWVFHLIPWALQALHKALVMKQLPCLGVCVHACMYWPVPTKCFTPHPLPASFQGSTIPCTSFQIIPDVPATSFCPPPRALAPSALLFYPWLFPSSFILTPSSSAVTPVCKLSLYTWPLCTYCVPDPGWGLGFRGEKNLLWSSC